MSLRPRKFAPLETFDLKSADWIASVSHHSGLTPRRNVLASKLTTFCIGGPLEAVFEVQTLDDLQRLMLALRHAGQPARVIGAGSNLLVSSDGLGGAFVRLGSGFREIQPCGGDRVLVGAGVSLMTLSRALCESGLSGLEFAGGIPASIGGAARMNAGAHGGQMSDVISSLSFLLPDGTLEKVLACDLQWGYRFCGLSPQALITQVELRMVPGNLDHIRELRMRCLQERKSKQPLTVPSAGSIFKNPRVDLSAGELVERAGLKGAAIGGASISPLHANWIVNENREAHHSDVLRLVARAQEEVFSQYSIKLEPEVVVWTV